jgi:hypothetical protein
MRKPDIYMASRTAADASTSKTDRIICISNWLIQES